VLAVETELSMLVVVVEGVVVVVVVVIEIDDVSARVDTVADVCWLADMKQKPNCG
jgi:hypothetical protein